MNLPITITKEEHALIWAGLSAYLAMTAVLRAAEDRALVPQNQGAADALMFLEAARIDCLHDILWAAIHSTFGTDPSVIYECHATPDFKAFTLNVAPNTPMH